MLKLYKDDREIFIKPFSYTNKRIEKILISLISTIDNGKVILSALPTKKINYIKSQMKGANKIEVFSRQGDISLSRTPLEQIKTSSQGLSDKPMRNPSTNNAKSQYKPS